VFRKKGAGTQAAVPGLDEKWGKFFDTIKVSKRFGREPVGEIFVRKGGAAQSAKERSSQ